MTNGSAIRTHTCLHNDHNLKDSFDAVKMIRSIPPELFDKDYQFVSFDVQSLFTSVPIQKTINKILDRVYNKKLINTNLKKRTTKNLLLDFCTKTPFSFDNVLYEKCDGVSMDSSLGLVLANIILTEVENVTVKPLIETSVLRFYCRYVDDNLVMIKKDKIQHVLNSFNSFDKNLRFTVDTFDNGNIHFLDIKILNNGETDIYIKDTNTGLYVQYHSYGHWNTKIACLRSLYDRAKKICSNQY